MKTGLCENCANYIYDGQQGECGRGAVLDEDEMARFLTGDTENCPYFDFFDEYSLVRKQN